MRISDWSSDVCSSDLDRFGLTRAIAEGPFAELLRDRGVLYTSRVQGRVDHLPDNIASALYRICQEAATNGARHGCGGRMHIRLVLVPSENAAELTMRSEEHTSELQSLMRISYAVFCLKKKNKKIHN